MSDRKLFVNWKTFTLTAGLLSINYPQGVTAKNIDNQSSTKTNIIQVLDLSEFGVFR